MILRYRSTMTTQDDYCPKATSKTMDDLYRVAESLEDKVDDILDELKDLSESCASRSYHAYGWHDSHDEPDY